MIDRRKASTQLYHDALNHPIWDSITCFLLISFELALSSIILWKVPYTEIDWQAYMEEVGWAWDKGERNYTHIRGSTGPLVYPAGFLYFYGALRWIVTYISKQHDIHPSSIFVGQILFLVLYILQMIVIVHLYIGASRSIYQYRKNNRDEKPSLKDQDTPSNQPYILWSWRFAMMLCCLSKRIHSIFILRLFNDGVAMLILYYAIYLFAMKRSWKIGCIVFSLAVSVKMNILLFAPGLLWLLLQISDTLTQTIGYLSICAFIQFLVGAPFLLTFPLSYLRKAFELDRVFTYQWTVNLKFLPESIFVSKPLSILLLSGHVITLIIFALKWYHHYRKQNHYQGSTRRGLNLSPEYIIYTLFVSNYIGIVFARTLHYQFYSWYFHSVPFLLWMTNIHLLFRVTIIGFIEYSFNVFPATFTSSIFLQLAHWLLLGALYLSDMPQMYINNKKEV